MPARMINEVANADSNVVGAGCKAMLALMYSRRSLRNMKGRTMLYTDAPEAARAAEVLRSLPMHPAPFEMVRSGERSRGLLSTRANWVSQSRDI